MLVAKNQFTMFHQVTIASVIGRISSSPLAGSSSTVECCQADHHYLPNPTSCLTFQSIVIQSDSSWVYSPNIQTLENGERLSMFIEDL